MLKLQNILLPSPETCTEQALYFRCSENAAVSETDEGGIRIPEKTTLVFDTYFNGLSIEKWHKYTGVREVSLTVRLQGEFRLVLMTRILEGETVRTEILGEKVCCTQGDAPCEFTLPICSDVPKGMYCFSLEALRPSVFYGGCYEAEPVQVRPVKLAIDICTFRREAFITKNLELLRKRFLDNPDSFLRDKLEIFVVDNAGTLDAAQLSADAIHMFRNKNVGGAGGFARGMIEIGKLREARGITHILVADDDIVFEPEAIFRTCMMLSCVKEEYRNAFVGGAMLRLDTQYMQVESGAIWNQGELISLKQGLDLRDLKSCLENETEEQPDYNAWWYCVFPAEVPAEDNLPMPIFFRGDDVEYGIRNMKQLILLNGICVWHEPFENKYSSIMSYYILRNRMMDNAVHGISLSRDAYKKLLSGYVRYELRLYRYKTAALLMQGAEDFLAGVDWLAAQDGEALHQRIMDAGYKPQPVEELGEDIVFDSKLYEASWQAVQPTDPFHRVLASRTLNGTWLTPKRKYAIIPMEGAKQISVFRTETILNYDEISGRGFVTRRDPAEAKACLARLKALENRIDAEYEQVIRDYAENGRKLWTLAFWTKYLGLAEA